MYCPYEFGHFKYIGCSQDGLELHGNTKCEFKIQIRNKWPQKEYIVIYTLLENKGVYARNK